MIAEKNSHAKAEAQRRAPLHLADSRYPLRGFRRECRIS